MRLTLRKSSGLDDWYVIERAEHEGKQWLEETGPGMMSLRDSARFSDADVEGTRAEMLAIAGAIEARSQARFKRCRVEVTGPGQADEVLFDSPRNSTKEGRVTLVEADELAKEIRKKLDGGAK